MGFGASFQQHIKHFVLSSLKQLTTALQHSPDIDKLAPGFTTEWVTAGMHAWLGCVVGQSDLTAPRVCTHPMGASSNMPVQALQGLG